MEKVLTKKSFSPIVKGVLFAVSCSIVCVLLFALIYRFVDISDMLVKIINQIIKVVSIALGVFVALKKDSNKGLMKGALIGVLYTLLSYTVFSALVASFSFGLNIIYDLLFSSIVGVICGVIFANLKK